MRITPITSKEIIGRYRKQANTILDSFTNQVLLQSNNKAKVNKVYKQLNTIGLVNAKILDNNAHNPKQAKLLYVLI